MWPLLPMRLATTGDELTVLGPAAGAAPGVVAAAVGVAAPAAGVGGSVLLLLLPPVAAGAERTTRGAAVGGDVDSHLVSVANDEGLASLGLAAAAAAAGGDRATTSPSRSPSPTPSCGSLLLRLLSFSASAVDAGGCERVSNNGTGPSPAAAAAPCASLTAKLKEDIPLAAARTSLPGLCPTKVIGPLLLTTVLMFGLLLLLEPNRVRAAPGDKAGMLLLRPPPAAACAVGFSMSAGVLVEKELKRGLNLTCDLQYQKPGW